MSGLNSLSSYGNRGTFVKRTMAFMTVISVIAVFGLIVAPANAKSAQQEQLEKYCEKSAKN